MALTKIKKAELIASYKELISNAKSLVYVGYKGLPVKKQDKLRKALIQNGLGYTVVKKSLWQKALDTQTIKGENPNVSAEIAILYGVDEMAPAKEAAAFAKENKENFVILGGIWGGEYRDTAYMKSIASIPSREILLSQLAYLLKSPMQKLAIAINEVVKKKV